jgi:Mn-dependent DtxR family transcriptional regulator
MMNKKQIWEVSHRTLRAFAPHYQPHLDATAKKFGLDPPTWYPLIPAHTFMPDPTSVERLRVRSPYSSPRYYEEPILSLYERGFLVESPLGGYTLTAEGDEAVNSITESAYESMQAIPVLGEGVMQSLAYSLGRLVQACMIYGEPISRWSIIYSRRLDEAPIDAYSAKIDQYLSDLAAFRDDAHLASWKSYNVSGHAWDILSSVWKDGPLSIKKVSDQLARRRWSMAETDNAVDELRNRGWIEVSGDLSVTEKGKDVRDESESLTDKYFFSPWSTVDDRDLTSISELLPNLTELLLGE